MTREERCKLAIERGYTYNPETGLIYNRYNKLSNGYNNEGYIIIGITKNKKVYQIKGHQFAWYWVYKECVNCLDHINRIKDDNRIINLRNVTQQQNCFNKTCKGYTWFKRDSKWKAQITINKKKTHLGLFNTEQEAKNAYLAAKEKYHKL